MKELNKVTTMLEAPLSNEEVEEFMKEADVVRRQINLYIYHFMVIIL